MDSPTNVSWYWKLNGKFLCKIELSLFYVMPLLYDLMSLFNATYRNLLIFIIWKDLSQLNGLQDLQLTVRRVFDTGPQGYWYGIYHFHLLILDMFWISFSIIIWISGNLVFRVPSYWGSLPTAFAISKASVTVFQTNKLKLDIFDSVGKLIILNYGIISWCRVWQVQLDRT